MDCVALSPAWNVKYINRLLKESGKVHWFQCSARSVNQSLSQHIRVKPREEYSRFGNVPPSVTQFTASQTNMFKPVNKDDEMKVKSSLWPNNHKFFLEFVSVSNVKIKLCSVNVLFYRLAAPTTMSQRWPPGLHWMQLSHQLTLKVVKWTMCFLFVAFRLQKRRYRRAWTCWGSSSRFIPSAS